MDNTAGEAIFILKIDAKQAETSLSTFQGKLSDTTTEGQQQTKSLAAGFDELSGSIASIATAGLALGGVSSAIGDLTSAYNDYQSAMNGVKTVASATGNSVSASLSSIKEITASGLISQEDAAAAMKNLQLYGYSVEEATQMIKIMTDAAVYNRQANYSVSEAVRVTTEGIRMENSALSDASGITTNIAKMHENYAAQLGKTTADLTDAEKAQAVYNGYLQEGGIFAGNAESYTSTLAGSQQRLETALTQVKQIMGGIFDQFAPIVNGLAQWISENQELVATIGATIGILTAAGGLVGAFSLVYKAAMSLSKAIGTLGVVSNAAKFGLVGLATSAAAVGGAILVSNALDGMIEDIATTTEEAETANPTLRNMAERISNVGVAASSSSDEVSKLNKQLATLDRDYQRDLKKIANKHEENLNTLTQQIKEANVDYRQAIAERVADFNVTLAKQERSHQETVDELMTQLNFLQRYNNDYNKQKLLQVQFALNKEQQLYKRETEAQQAELELQNAADKAKLDQRLASLQTELDEELAFMNKHRDALNSVRDVILLDEIESLQERYNEQKASYQQQIDEAAKAGAEAGDAYSNGFNNSLSEGLKRIQSTVKKATSAALGAVGSVLSPKALVTLTNPGFSSGGYTGRGATNEVAGVVHRGEYVVPASQVDQNTGTPNFGAQSITINLSGVLATSQQAKRELAQELLRALGQTNQARLS